MLLQRDLLPGLDRVDVLHTGVVSCKMTQRAYCGRFADAVPVSLLNYSGEPSGPSVRA